MGWTDSWVPLLQNLPVACVKALCACTMMPLGVSGNPLPTLYRRGIDPSADAWSDTIAGVGPLILLVGEQSTKQLLCTVTGVANAFSLATAPLGLLSIVTSLLRLCGIEQLRAFIGHDLEARTVAAVEMTRVNCGGVYAELVDGYLTRNTNGHPAGVAIGVSILEGAFGSVSEDVVRQVLECDAYKDSKRRKGIPEDCAQVRWCIQIISHDATAEIVDDVIEMLASIHGIDSSDQGVRRFQSRLGALYRKSSKRYKKLNSLLLEDTDIEIASPTASNNIKSMRDTETKLSYVLSFDAVSEFSTTAPPSRMATTAQGMTSMIAILTVYFIALWRTNWSPSAGWILGVLGYTGIVLGVIGGSLIIHSSCEYVTLNTVSSSSSLNWIDGIIFSPLAPDSMDTSGSTLWSTSTHRPQRFEAVWRKHVTTRRSQIASLVALIMVSSYICHYLGLRALPWWVSSGELAICILSAFVRSVLKDAQAKFQTREDVKMDRRCSSTGVIRVQASERIPPSVRSSSSIDVRAYDQHTGVYSPIDGERIAWYIASQYSKDRAFRMQILDLTGLFLQVVPSPEDRNKVIILVSFQGGILVEEGLAYPESRMTVAFRCTPSDLEAPTPLLSRAIMRQPKWMIKHEEMKAERMPLGRIHLFSINSMMSWWTISEDRNDMADMQKHLNWPMLLVNVAFFMSILMSRGTDTVGSKVGNTFRDFNERVTFSNLEQEMSEGLVDYIKKTDRRRATGLKDATN